MKFLLMIFFLLFFSQAYHKQDIIQWSPDRKLKWNDFKKTIKENHRPGSDLAYVFTGFAIIPEHQTDTSILYSIYAYCSKEKSAKSVDSKELTDLRLKHEQGHFDIREWYARVLRKELEDTVFSNLKSIHMLYTKIYKESDTAEDLYDSLTNHGNDTNEQYKWFKIIATKLSDYSKYSNPEIMVHIRKSE